MRFILNFFFFGLLFYIIWLYFPDAFTTLVNWAAQVVDFVKETFHSLTGRLPSHDTPSSPEPAPNSDSIRTLFQYLSVLIK